MCVLSGFRLHSILFRFRISKFEKGWDDARVAIRIQLDNVLSWVGRDISRYISSFTTQLSWQIYKSRRYSLLKVSFFFFVFSFFLYFPFSKSFPRVFPFFHPTTMMAFIWQMLSYATNNSWSKQAGQNYLLDSFYLFCKFIYVLSFSKALLILACKQKETIFSINF